MNVNLPLLAFPLLPVAALFVALAGRHLLHRDWSLPVLRLALAGQCAAGAWLCVQAAGLSEPLTVPLSVLEWSIVFGLDRTRAWFLAAYLTPAVLAFQHLRILDTFQARVIFLFYLTGCSGLAVTADLFNFFVFYEVMIMAGYALVSVKGRFYAGVVYMLIGAVSSAFLLGGIVAWYGSGGAMGFADLARAGGLPHGNLVLIFTFFSVAFYMKSGLFPVSSWPATCHAATNGVVSAFLSSFTIFSGLFGLHFLVLQPAAAMGLAQPFVALRIFSLLTMATSLLFLFFEPDMKRCVAGSTVFSIGLTGALLSMGHTEAAWKYVLLHAAFKSILFLACERATQHESTVRVSAAGLLAGTAALLLAVGPFPSPGYFLKSLASESVPDTLILLLAMPLLTASFAKFAWRAAPGRRDVLFLATAGLLIGAPLVLFNVYKMPSQPARLLLDAALLIAAVLGARPLFLRSGRLVPLDRRFVYPNLNVELLFVVALLIGHLVLFRLLP